MTPTRVVIRRATTYESPALGRAVAEAVEALGGWGAHVETPDGIRPALEQAFASGRPACINVPLDPRGMAKTGASTPYIV